MKKIIFSVFIFLLIFALTGCGNKTVQSDKKENSPNTVDTINTTNNTNKGDVGNDICAEFGADFIYSATGKPVVKVEPDVMAPKLACRFFFTYSEDFYKGVDNKALRAGGLHIFMMLENRSAADQKKANEFLGLTVKTDPRIKMENQINYRENGTLYDIRLIINPNRYLRMDTNKGITDDELIQFAAKVAEKIQGNLSFEIKANPAETKTDNTKTEEAGASQQSVAESFMSDLSALKINDALAKMDANDSTKKMWEANFNTIESLSVKKVEEAFKEEWTATRQTFKFELDAKVKPAGEQLGWNQGTNFRWVSLEKNSGGAWLIHEIANNP
jgi:hypothetical protein